MLTEHEKIELYVQASNLLYEKDKEFTDIEDEIKKEKQKENISRKIAILRKFLEATDYKVFFEEKKNKRVIYQVINILVETRYNVLKDIVKIENKKLLKDDVGLLKVQTKSWDNLPKEKKIEKELEIMKKLKAIEEMKDIDLEKRSVEDIIKNEAGGFFTGGESLLINRFLRFFINIKKLEKKKSTYIYTVEPKEYAQNISQVQAAEKLKNLVLSLKAILPSKGAKVGSYLNHLKRSQMKMNSILRKPLVVGYIDGRQKFGWFLGPRFQLNREKNVNFEHTPVQYSLQASIVTPGWHKEIELTGTYKWDNYGNTPLWKKKGLCKKKDTIRALLPGDMSSLTKALMNLYGGKHRQPPYIIPGRGSSTILLEAERTEYVLIKGKRLWRNPEVFIGSQKANNIEILPDMQGLLATFDKVQMPVKPWGVGPKVDPKVDLTVITSNGSATLSKVVAIREAPKKKPVSKPKTKAKITNIQAYKSGNFTLSIPAKSIPEKAAAIQLLVKPKGSKDWKVLKTGGHTFGPKKEKITFKEIDYKEGNAELSAELQYKDKKSSSFISIPVVGGVDDSFIYFTSEELFKATLTPLEITCTKTGPTGKKVDWIKNNILISFFNPTLFLKATPGLQEAIDGGFELLLSLDKDDKDGNASGILKIEKEKGHFKYTKKGKTGTIKIISSKLESTEIDGIDWIVNKFDDTITKKYFYLQIELPNRKQLDLKKRKLTIEFKK
ncbi:MAG: hypothetical protein KAW12_10380 [Candidatus Aminicenantes bacterium]|nr:hypothetical protein [Candidatus Aminicenantes bacterium]